MPTQVCSGCGDGAPSGAHFCPRCSTILPLGRGNDYFSYLGVPRRLNLDPSDLEQRFRALSRQFHPDFFYNRSAAERRASLERSSHLNDAYRTLRQPAARLEYLLQLEGLAPAAGRNGSSNSAHSGNEMVPQALLEQVFELNEELDAVRELRADGTPADELKRRLDEARRPIEAKGAGHEAQLAALSAEWDTLDERNAPKHERSAVLEGLRHLMLERHYLRNLLAGIEEELAR